MPGAGRKTVPLLLSLALLLAALPGCVNREARIPTLSPRIPPTEDHLSARESSDCLGCHEASSLRADHSPKDVCRKCHKICHGRYE